MGSSHTVSRRILVLCALMMFFAVACGGSDFGRGDAIERFRTGGASEAEATCMTEALIVLDKLEVANPNIAPDEAGVVALVTAGHSCVPRS